MVQTKSKNIKRINIGYTTGVFDLFHIGHLNILKNSKAMCDKLIVGVTVDELVKYKYKKAVIPFSERIEIIRSCKYVDLAIPQYDIDKVDTIKKIKANYLFVGDDWYKSKKWKDQENELKKINCKVIYFPYTKGTSSTLINKSLNKLRKSKL
jgi:glycerol-3-phosphate cytidylyltransferase